MLSDRRGSSDAVCTRTMARPSQLGNQQQREKRLNSLTQCLPQQLGCSWCLLHTLLQACSVPPRLCLTRSRQGGCHSPPTGPSLVSFMQHSMTQLGIEVVSTSQRTLSKELKISFKLLCATTAPTRLFLPPSQTSGQPGFKLYEISCWSFEFFQQLAQCRSNPSALQQAGKGFSITKEYLWLDSDCSEKKKVVVLHYSYHNHMHSSAKKRELAGLEDA